MKENVTVENGILRLTAKKETNTINSKTHPYTSGQIRTTDYKYGYFEIRAKLPSGNGFWPAFWFYSGCSTDKYREIDVFENCGCDCSVIKSGYFFETYSGSISHNFTDFSTEQSKYLVADVCHDFHIYGLEWTPSSLIFYFDGHPILCKTNPGFNIAMPIILNLAVSRNNACYGGCGLNYCGDFNWEYNNKCVTDCDTHFPSSFEIDYLKIWKKTEESFEIIGPGEICISELGRYYAPYFPNANYVWSIDSDSIQLFNTWRYWGCDPKGVYNVQDIVSFSSGNKILSLKIKFPDGKILTSQRKILIYNQPPFDISSIKFTKDLNSCCYFPNCTKVTNAEGYFWEIDNNNFYTKDNFSNFCIEDNYFHSVKVTAFNACGKSTPFSISKLFSKLPCDWKLNITPNPATEIVTISVVENMTNLMNITFSVSISDLMGNLKFSNNSFENGSQIHLLNLPTGLYNINVEYDGNTFSKIFSKF
ncbi:MAG: family 16 glycosylhydrolase [Saprospiraceae bacterium]|nr:family 16 glycosylhydrolase [Saprospiraceae bacterium]